MRNLFKNTLKSVLRFLAQATIRRFTPTVVGITGSVGKTSAKSAAVAVVGATRRVRMAPDSHNNEFGFPLTILGVWSESDLKLVSRKSAAGGHVFRKIWFWGKVIVLGFVRLVFMPKRFYPEVLVLEYGADRPGDLRYLLEIARPTVGLVTAIGEIPVHIAFYEDAEAVVREKSRLVEAVPASGVIILNADDPRVLGMKEKTRAKVITFGFGEASEVRITNFEHRFEEKDGVSVPVGVSFKLNYAGSFVPVRIPGAGGRAQAYAVAGSAAIGVSFNLNLVTIAQALTKYQAAPSRMQFIPGIHQSLLIDDSYNAAPLSMRLALTTLEELPAKRRVAVIGDMRELGSHSAKVHRDIGALASGICDLLVAVGTEAQFIVEGALTAGLKQSAIIQANSAEEVVEKLPDLIKPHDLVLIKASRAVGLEAVVKSLTKTD